MSLAHHLKYGSLLFQLTPYMRSKRKSIMETVKFKEIFGVDEADWAQRLVDVYLRPTVDLDGILGFLRCLEGGGEGIIGTSVAFCHHGGNLGEAPPLEPLETKALLNTALVKRTPSSSFARTDGIVLTDAGRKFLKLFDGNPYLFWTVKVDGEVFPWAGGARDSFDPNVILGEYGRQVRPGETVSVSGPYPYSGTHVPGEAFLIYRFGPKTISSWFSAVINPLLRFLRMEADYLRAENWTWEWQSEELESIRPVRDHLDPESVDTLEQFLSYYPNVRAKADEHDEAVRRLVGRCRDLQASLAKSPALRRLYDRAISEGSLTDRGRTVEQVFGAYSEVREHLEIISQHIVNNKRSLPDYYPISTLWRQYGGEFLGLLGEPGISEQKKLTQEDGKKLLDAVEGLADTLKDTRERLSIENDVPIVPQEPAE
jgi:hypothetical protein